MNDKPYRPVFKNHQYHHDGAIVFHFLISDLPLSAHMQSSGTPATTSMKAAVLAGLGTAASILLL